MFKRTFLQGLAASALALSGALSPASARDLPPIKILVGFVPGGTSDVVARLLADELRQELQRNVVVENRPGAIGRVAAQSLLTLPHDGSHYLFSPDSWAIFPTLLHSEATLKYNYLRDFQPVAKVISYPLGLYASKGAGVTQVKEFVAKAKTDPQYTLYASTGSGGITEFLGLVMSREFGVKMTTVPYKGAADVKNALMGNQAMSGMMAPGDLAALIKEGRIVPLGFMTKERWSVMPDVPTLREQGYDITQGEAFMGLWASAKTPATEVAQMEAAVRTIVAKPAFREKVIRASVYPDFAGARELDQQVRSLLAFWQPLVQANGYR